MLFKSKKVNINDTKKAWKERGFTCNEWIDPPGQVWENFIHKQKEILMCLEGKLEITINGKTTKVKIGEEIIIPKQTLHSVKNIGSKDCKWLYGYKLKGKL